MKTMTEITDRLQAGHFPDKDTIAALPSKPNGTTAASLSLGMAATLPTFPRNLQAPRGPSIDKTEMRAMTLTELLDLKAVISSTRLAQQWTDMRFGTPLNPTEVNMYHFNFYVICPQTATTIKSHITIVGLQQRHYSGGQVLEQRGPDGMLIPVGSVSAETEGTDVKIEPLRGQFQGKHLSIAGDVFLDGEPIGIPDGVYHKNSMAYKETVSSTPTAPTWSE